MHTPSRSVPGLASRSIAPLVALLVAMFCAAGTATAATTEWTPGPTFGADTNVSVAPVVVGDDAGGITAAWGVGGSSSTRATVVAQHVAADGARGPLLTLGFTQWPGDLSAPRAIASLRLVPTASGAVVEWQDPGAADPNSDKLDLKFARVSGAAVSAPVTVATGLDESTGPTLAPGLATNAAGDVLVSWWNNVPHVQRFAADGTAGPDLILPTAKAPFGALPVVMLADGTGRVAYRSSSDTLLAARIKPDGTLDGAPVTVTTAGQKLHGPPLLAAGDGVAAITWGEAQSTSDGTPLTLRSARLPSTGDVATPGRIVTEGLIGPVTDYLFGAGVAVTIRPNGTIVNAWGVISSDGTNITGTALRASTLGSNDVVAAPLAVASPDVPSNGASSIYPELSGGSNGAVTLAWIEVDNSLFVSAPTSVDQLQHAYRARALTIGPDDSLGPATSPVSLHFAAPGTIDFPFAPGSSGGHSLLSWTEAGGTGSVIKTMVENPVVVPTPTPAPVAPQTPTPPAAPVVTAPKLSLVTFSKTSLVAGDPAVFLLTSSAAGLVKVAISKPTSGRKVTGKCVAPSKKNAKKPKCTFDKAITTITQTHAAGRTSIAFNGKVGKKKLAVGTYKATITVTGSTGLVSPATVITFKVKAKKSPKKK